MNHTIHLKPKKCSVFTKRFIITYGRRIGSSDKVYEWTEAVKMEQQFDPYDADQAQIKQELAQLRKEP